MITGIGTAGGLSAGIETELRPLSDIKAMAGEILGHIDLHDAGETASIWLANARSALKSAVRYVEGHFAEPEANLVEPMTSNDAAVAGGAAASV